MKKSVETITNGTIDDSMWQTILETMYREEDSNELQAKIRDAIEERAQERYLNQSKANISLNTSKRSLSPVKVTKGLST